MIAAKMKAVRHRKTTGAAKPLAAPVNVGTAPPSTSRTGIRMPLMAVGMASDIQTIAAQTVVAIAAFPAAGKPFGRGNQIRIAKKQIQAIANPPIEREVARRGWPGAAE